MLGIPFRGLVGLRRYRAFLLVVARSRPSRISLPKTYIMYPGRMSQAPLRASIQ